MKDLDEKPEVEEKRKIGKELNVVSFPSHGKYVPSIRVAGEWLKSFDFKLGDKVTLTARQGEINITRKEEVDANERNTENGERTEISNQVLG